MGTEQQKHLAADVLGITGRYDRVAAIGQALMTLGYPTVSPIYENSSIPPPTERLMDERDVDIQVVQQIIKEEACKKGKVYITNTLTDWFMYQILMKNFGRKITGEGTALMIGSLTAMSSRAFVRLAEEEYGTDRNHIIDLFSTQAKARHGDFFARASGLNVPFASGSIDIVHTNRLLHQLKDPSSNSEDIVDDLEYTVPRLMQEITRVLTPNGQLFMLEVTPKVETTETSEDAEQLTGMFAGLVLDCLKESEYESACALFGLTAPNTNFLFDPSRAFPDNAEPNFATFAIHASRS